jgi:putative N6-adenine-specific DNA methylase
MYEYQKSNRFFAQIADGIIELGAEELSGLGARKIRSAYGGIYFNAGKEVLYGINYSSRIASRILAPLASFDCSSTDDLYEKATQVNWTDFFSLKNTFAVFCNVSNSRITNSHFASLRLKDGIVDSFLATSGIRPNVNAKNPDVWLNLHIRNDKAVISLDTSGGSLHRRGYRKESIEAPMQETVAAAIIGYSGWNGEVPLYDPMCGSGTLLCEALMHYCNIPSGIFREQFGFYYMPDFDEPLWTMVKNELHRQIRELPEGLIAGNDSSRKALIISGKNLQNLPHGEKVRLEGLDFRKSTGLENGIIVTNPPYGIRMGNRQHIDSLFKSLGDFLKHKCRGSSAYIYFGERELIKKIGLKPAWKKPLKTGGLDGRLVKYELY